MTVYKGACSRRTDPAELKIICSVLYYRVFIYDIENEAKVNYTRIHVCLRLYIFMYIHTFLVISLWCQNSPEPWSCAAVSGSKMLSADAF